MSKSIWIRLQETLQQPAILAATLALGLFVFFQQSTAPKNQELGAHGREAKAMTVRKQIAENYRACRQTQGRSARDCLDRALEEARAAGPEVEKEIQQAIARSL
jgi:uncharacterized protein HemX